MPKNQARRPNVNQNRFASVPNANIARSTFNRSHGHKTTFDAGRLIPIYVDEVLPGDTFTMSTNGFIRLATPIKPIMDNMTVSTFWFFVPHRLVWDNWQKFNGEQDNPGDSTDFVIPICSHTPSSGQLFDYMGWPVGVPVSGSALPLRSYNLIVNEWFRDQNLTDRLDITKGDGPDTAAFYNVVFRSKRHDYFTSSLPWPQKGDSVQIPLGNEAEIFTRGPVGGQIAVTNEGTGLLQRFDAVATTPDVSVSATTGGPTLMWADLSDASAVTINTLRQAFQIQKLLERDARGGTRYTEIVRSHFGVTSPDARLQRPEYLGGGSAPLNIAPVAQTGATASDVQQQDTPQANLAGIGTVTFGGHGWSKSFTEHGTVIGLVNARADLTYQQGLNRMWSRKTRYDFYWPALAMIGEQAVPSKEIYMDGTPDDDTVWGYQERYAEYRYAPSRISGQFRSNALTPIDIWHLSENFTTRPLLDDAFIQDTVPALKDRVVATPTEPDFIADFWFNLKCARPMPVYGVPGLIDHF